ncbi:MAG TPA: LD-carboxypeptidase [Myxococcota bacterium]|nr:LD-carboxypeptidase [Myxococcota bacterium]HRY92886.1 LD-carboxypeptidase [Myxococcota bacterium]HSA21520.1 LD-carboxypeptidase [Myxococcota bacterium]
MAPWRTLRPQSLRAGDRVRLVAPASPYEPAAYRAGRAALSALGFRPLWHPAEAARQGFLAGDDAARAARLRAAFAEADSRAVCCIRGGYGTARLLPLLELASLAGARKILVGFSDLTALLVPLVAEQGLVCFHGPVLTQLARLPAGDRAWLRALLTGQRGRGPVPLGRLRCVRAGSGEGRLLGGNLTVLASLCGGPHAPRLSGCLACLEDVGEPAYRLDRAFRQLQASGAFAGVRGLILGQLEGCTPAGRGEFGARAVLERAALELGVPVVSGAPFGHGRRNVALPFGVRARLRAGGAAGGVLELTEPAVEAG